MADFDPMVLRTRYNRLLAPVGSYDSLILNGKLEKWTNVAALADNWTENTGWTGITLNRLAGTRTGGAGLYVQRIRATGHSAGTFYQMYQTYVMLGHAQFDACGHYNKFVAADAWVRNAGTTPGNYSARLIIEMLSSTGGLLGSPQYGSIVTLSATWQQIWVTLATANTGCRQLRLTVRIICDVATPDPDINVDDVEMYEEYTFARNPSMPDEGEIMVPGRNFSRTIGGTLLRGRPAAVTAKWEKQLNFGLIGKTQVEALRSLYLHDVPMEWVPNHPLLPALLEVRWIGDFDFKLISSAAGTNHYGGRAVFSEY